MHRVNKEFKRLYWSGSLELGQKLKITEPAIVHQLTKVWRVQVAEQLELFNNTGYNFAAKITELTRSSCGLIIIAAELAEVLPGRVNLGLAALKPSAMDLSVQKATELGVDSISVLYTDYTSVAKAAIAGKQEHWLKICQHAAAQANRSTVPAVLLPGNNRADAIAADIIEKAGICGGSLAERLQAISGYCQQEPASRHIFLSPEFASSLGDLLVTGAVELPPPACNTAMTPGLNTTIPPTLSLTIGPEGGFSATELEQMQALQVAWPEQIILANLGKLILRAETAVIVALALVSQKRW